MNKVLLLSAVSLFAVSGITAAHAMGNGTTSSFQQMSPGNKAIVNALHDSQTPSQGTVPLTRNQIASQKESGEGWGQVFHDMQADGLTHDKNLGQAVSDYRHGVNEERHEARLGDGDRDRDDRRIGDRDDHRFADRDDHRVTAASSRNSANRIETSTRGHFASANSMEITTAGGRTETFSHTAGHETQSGASVSHGFTRDVHTSSHGTEVVSNAGVTAGGGGHGGAMHAQGKH